MITLLPEFLLHDLHPSFYDKDSVTTIELVGRLHGKVNEVVEAYNKFATKVNQDVTDFMESNNKDFELFRVGLRQEFQDFIDIVNLKVKDNDVAIQEFMEEIRSCIEQQHNIIEETHKYFTEEVANNIQEAVIEKVNSGQISLDLVYHADAEHLVLDIIEV